MESSSIKYDYKIIIRVLYKSRKGAFARTKKMATLKDKLSDETTNRVYAEVKQHKLN